MTRTLINDTANVIFRRKSDQHTIFTAEAQLASIAQAVTEDKLKGGIGNRTIALLRSDKEVTLQVRNALFDLEWLSMTQGVKIESGSATVWKREENLIVVDETGTLEVTITGTAKGDTATIINAQGESEEATVTTNKITVPVGHAEKDEKVSVVYQADVTGDIVKIDSSKFSESYEVEYQTIEYDPISNKVVKDLYIQFDHVVPSGAFDLSFENGTALTPELSFEAMTAGGNTEIGRFIEVERV